MGIWTRKTIDQAIASSDDGDSPTLKRHLGPYSLIALGIGVIIGAGLFSITGIAAAQYAGPAIIISFIIAAIGCAFAGLCYCELASMLPIAGSAYTYASVAIGELFAWIIGWDLILEYAIGAAAVSISWSAYVVSFLNDFGIDLPSSLIASPWHPTMLPDGTIAYGIINLPAVLITATCTLLLIRGIKESATVNNIFVLIKLAVIFIFIAVGVWYIKPENYTPFIPENSGTFGIYGWSGIFRASGIVFMAYIGFDSLSTAAQEAENPKRDMPIAILGALAICTALYVLFSFVLVGIVDYSKLNVAAPVALAVDQTPYWWLTWLIKLAILAGLSSVILVLLMGQSRIFYAMARDKLLPPLFSDLHPQWHTPWKASIALMLLVSLVGAFVPLEALASMTSIGTLFAFVIVCGAVLVLRYRHPEYPRAFKTPGMPVVPILGIAICLMIMCSLDSHTWLRLAIWMTIGLLLYFFYGKNKSVV
jgi:APA family basic amino acid/polyamine antiporter